MGEKIAEEKVQSQPPFQYLGYILKPRHFSPQKLTIRTSGLTTLNDFQKLLGDINWIRPALGITTDQLQPLFEILQGDPDPSSPRELTPAATNALQLVEQALSSAKLQFCNYHEPWDLIILASPHTPTGVLYQQGILYWIHGKSAPERNLVPYYNLVALRIMQGRKLSTQFLGKDPDSIILPYTALELEWLLNMYDSFTMALASYAGTIRHHLPNDKLLHFMASTPHIIQHLTSSKPIPGAITLFTDGSSNGRAMLLIGEEVKV